MGSIAGRPQWGLWGWGEGLGLSSRRLRGSQSRGPDPLQALLASTGVLYTHIAQPICFRVCVHSFFLTSPC